jgi:RNA polymerase sigma-70 factor (ECF subfamily)
VEKAVSSALQLPEVGSATTCAESARWIRRRGEVQSGALSAGSSPLAAPAQGARPLGPRFRSDPRADERRRTGDAGAAHALGGHEPEPTASPLAEGFERHCSRARECLSQRELAERLDCLTAEARDRWPEIELPLEAWMRHLAERVDPSAPLESLRTLDGPGSFLACACLAGDARALRALDGLLQGAPFAALRRLRLDGAAIDEVLQRLRERLLLAGDEAPRLARYSGRGSLEGWLRTSAVRLASDMKAERRPESDPEALLFAVASGPSPESAAIRKDARAHAKAALGRALGALSSRQRALLRLSIVEGLSIDRIAPVYGSSRATIARWLQEARRELVAATRRELCCRLQLQSAEIDRWMASLESQIDLSLSRALAAEGPS